MDPFFVRNLVYGLEDSVISTTGVVVGVTFAGLPYQHVIITGIVLVLVEAMSMAFGAFMSEESFLITANESYTTTRVLLYAATMFVSYASAGAYILVPYLLNLRRAYAWSIGFALAALFTITYIVKRNPWRALAITAIGGVILAVTIVVGRWIEHNGNHSPEKNKNQNLKKE